MYWATGGMHSGETGSVEMLMELAYRIAVDESPFVKTIRENAITLITPILEVDGRDKQVDISMAKRKDPKANVSSRLVYWGKYVSHDDNRDNLGLALKLSQYIMKVFLDYHPTVMHDLHESVSHLYISTGTGPYNAWLDPIVIDEWNLLAYREVDELTKLGVPGVWTQGFYDGWAPNYAFYAANGHNSIGRFYETQGAGDASTRVIGASPDRAWFRPNPPLRSAALVHPQQRQPPAKRRPRRHEPRRHAQGQVPGELLSQEQALHRQGPRRRPGRLRLPRRRSPARPGGPAAPPCSRPRASRSTGPTRPSRSRTRRIRPGATSSAWTSPTRAWPT